MNIPNKYKFKIPHYRGDNEFICLAGPPEKRTEAILELEKHKIVLNGNCKEQIIKMKLNWPIAYDLIVKDIITTGTEYTNYSYPNVKEFVAAILGQGTKSIVTKCICDRQLMCNMGCQCGAFKRELEMEDL